jgi:Icc protein
MNTKSWSSWWRRFALIVLLLPCLQQTCLADTLYQRSLAQFQSKALKANPDDFTFVVLGDSRDGDQTFAKVLKLADSFHPLFILHGGDYSGHGGESATSKFLELLKKSVPGLPVFVVMGNHEERPVFVKLIGPLDFTVHSKRLGLTLIGVDNSDTALKPAELDYLRSQLSSATGSVFVAMHVPPKTERWGWHTFTEGAEEFKAMLAMGKVQALFFSHMHLFDRSEYGGVPAFISGGAGAPLHTNGPGQAVNHILVVRMKKGQAAYQMVPLPK